MKIRGITRLAGATLAATVVLGAAAACVGSSAGTGATSGASSPSTSGAAASASASSGAILTGSSPSTNSGAGHSTEAGASACTGSAIQVAVKSAGAAMNHFGDVLIFTNRGGSACTLRGYPGVAVVKGSTTLLNATRTLTGYMAADPGTSSPPLVTLAPGKSASAMVEWAGNAGEACYPNATGTLEATPPNTRSTSSFGTLTLGDNGICAGFEVHPVTSGVLPYVTG